MTLVLLPLVAIAAVVAWAMGVSPRVVAWASAIAVALLVVSTVALVGVGVVIDGDGEGDDDDSATFAVGATRTVDEYLTTLSDDRDFAAPSRPIDDLKDGEARLIEVDGLPGDGAGRARQCRADERRCGPAIPVQADLEGRARFLFEFTAQLPGDQSVDCGTEPCTILVTDVDGERLVSVPLVFGASVTTAVVDVDRSRGLGSEEIVSVSLTGFRPGPVTVTLCTPPGPVDPASCGSPAPEVVAMVGADGKASVELSVRAGQVGSRGAVCDRGRPCGVGVIGRPDVAVLKIGFSGTNDARPGRAQVVVGLAIAAMLLLAAAVGIRRGPWTPPGGDPFAGIVLDDPFADLDLEPDLEADRFTQPATSRRVKDRVPAPKSAAT